MTNTILYVSNDAPSMRSRIYIQGLSIEAQYEDPKLVSYDSDNNMFHVLEKNGTHHYYPVYLVTNVDIEPMNEEEKNNDI